MDFLSTAVLQWGPFMKPFLKVPPLTHLQQLDELWVYESFAHSHASYSRHRALHPNNFSWDGVSEWYHLALVGIVRICFAIFLGYSWSLGNAFVMHLSASKRSLTLWGTVSLVSFYWACQVLRHLHRLRFERLASLEGSTFLDNFIAQGLLNKQGKMMK